MVSSLLNNFFLFLNNTFSETFNTNIECTLAPLFVRVLLTSHKMYKLAMTDE